MLSGVIFKITAPILPISAAAPSAQMTTRYILISCLFVFCVKMKALLSRYIIREKSADNYFKTRYYGFFSVR